MKKEDIPLSNFIYIKEQDLKIYIERSWSIFDQYQDMCVLIANELNIKNGQNMGALMAGIIRLVPANNEEGFEIKLVLPFSPRLLYAKFIEDNYLELAYMKDGHIEKKVIAFDEFKNLNYDDYAFLLTNPLNQEIEEEKRVLAKAN